jgi:superfamily II DNA or RNA helicase
MLTSHLQGYTYEKYILDLFKNSKDTYDNIWFYKEAPEYIIAKTSLYDSYYLYNKYKNCDIGADLVAIKDEQVFFIQCKNYSNTISINDLSSFYFLLYEYQLNGIVYYNGKLSERLTELSKGKVKYINIPFNNELINKTIIKPNTDNIIITPKQYQLEAVKILQNEHRSILSLPCGMGKTYTSYLIARNYNNIILISPNRSLADEILNNMYLYLEEKYNPILISMDGSRDPIYINTILKEKNIISVTYNSVDILNQVITNLINPFIIIDEYHNLSESNLLDTNNEFNKILNSKYPILFLSATPIENMNKKIFGNTIFKYEWSLAIENGYICDIKIILPEKKNYLNIFEKLLIDINYEKMNIKLVNKAYFLLRSLLYEGSKKCIVYLTSIENSEKFYNIIIWLQKLLNCNIKQYQINFFTPKTKKIEYINNFKTDSDISLILNVQILNEGINIPNCDSVYITNPNNNIINLIQRVSRCNRIMEEKNESKVYLWCSEKKTEKILNYINEKTNGELNKKVYKYNITENKTNVERYNYVNIEINNKKFITTLFDKTILEKITIQDKFNNLWFNAKLIFEMLNYKDKKDAIKYLRTFANTKNLKDIVDNYKIYKSAQPLTIYIDEYSLYTLLINTNKKESKKYYKMILDKLITL